MRYAKALIYRRRILKPLTKNAKIIFMCRLPSARLKAVSGFTKKYLGIQILRFYFKCENCRAEVTMKTDPQNSDYVVQSGATRVSKPFRAEDEEAEKKKQKRNAEEMGDAMKSLENKTFDSKREMDILAALDEMRSMKSRHSTVSTDAMLEALKRSAVEKKKLEEEDEALVKSIKFQWSKNIVRRINDDDRDSILQKRKVVDETPRDSSSNIDDSVAAGNAKSMYKFAGVSLLFVTKEAVISNSNHPPKAEGSKQVNEDKASVSTTGLQSICQSYASDDV